ncbi:MAG TPA: type 3 dihydrofolate reductase [Gammaproteobacteria bacterium]|nr:type 3 dihydrofolate reductase [Gammaproteobacteria bacterium]
MRIALIVAMDRRRGIGRDGRLPWRLPADLAWFRRVTMGKPVIMGRRTFESIGRPLPGRENIVLSRDPDYAAEGVKTAPDVAAALALAGDAEEVMILGGARVYAALLERADRIYLTEVHGDFDADVRFPELDPARWEEIRRIEQPADERNPYAMSFVVLERVRWTPSTD